MRLARRSAEWTHDELTELYRRYGFLLQRRCRTILRDEAGAEDALQDVFLKFIHAKAEITSAANPLAFMYRVTDRACFDLLRRRKVRRADSIDDHPDEIGPGIDIEARQAALRILHELTEPEYQVAIMAYVDGMNQTEIADALGVSRPTIWKRLTRIRARAALVLEGGFP